MENRIKELRRARGLTLQKLAKKAGTTNQQISRLERGERRLTTDWMERLAGALGCSPVSLIGAFEEVGPSRYALRGLASDNGEDAAPYHSEDIGLPGFPFTAGPKDLPVLGVAAGGEDAWFDTNGQANEYIERPPMLSGVSDAYAIYVIGDSMSPALREGHLVHVHPHKRATPGCEVVVQLADGRGLIKELVRRDNRKIVLRQHNPVKELSFDTAQISAVHRIVGRCDA
jgi:phage repressor protein C with HTH and peptisase S24 domain